MSMDDFIPYWTKMVSDEFGLDYDSLLAIYDRPNDVHKTEDKTRAIWKYGAYKGVAGTPYAYINGVKLDHFPESADAWDQLLTQVYESQWGVKSAPTIEDFLQ